MLGPKKDFKVDTSVGTGTKFSFTIFKNLEEQLVDSEEIFDSLEFI